MFGGYVHRFGDHARPGNGGGGLRNVQLVACRTVTAYGKEIAVGVLAVVSLFMMSSMVARDRARADRGCRRAEVEHAHRCWKPVKDSPAKSAKANATLDGMELDEDAVHTQQMLDQVSTMVKENPDGRRRRW